MANGLLERSKRGSNPLFAWLCAPKFMVEGSFENISLASTSECSYILIDDDT